MMKPLGHSIEVLMSPLALLLISPNPSSIGKGVGGFTGLPIHAR